MCARATLQRMLASPADLFARRRRISAQRACPGGTGGGWQVTLKRIQRPLRAGGPGVDADR